jgi:PPM family protein phosphatase
MLTASGKEFMSDYVRYRIQAYGCTDSGRVRESNEDSFGISSLSEGIHLERNGAYSFSSGRFGSLFMVADGMGGAAGGGVASRLAVQVLYRELMHHVRRRRDPDELDMEQLLTQGVAAANSEIYQKSRQNRSLRGMGTTLTTLFELNGLLVAGQIGDSRAYLLRSDGIRHVTRDQSLVAQMVSRGQITEEEARLHPERNVLLQAMGVEPRVQLTLRRLTLRPHDVYLLCSDGLHSQLRDEEIFEVVADSSSQMAACEELVDLANRRGGPDNITVLLVQFIPEVDDRPMETDH